MAEWNERNPENVEGRFYVDGTCIDCDLCRSSVPGIFKREDSKAYSYVYRQPQTGEEIEEAMSALDACPTSSIGMAEQLVR